MGPITFFYTAGCLLILLYPNLEKTSLKPDIILIYLQRILNFFYFIQQFLSHLNLHHHILDEVNANGLMLLRDGVL